MRSRWGWWSPHKAVTTIAIVLAVAGVAALIVASRQHATPPAQPSAAAAGHVAAIPGPPRASKRHPTSVGLPSVKPFGASPPIEIRIPRVGVRSSIVELGQNADGTVQVPASFQVAGWYRYGVTPGQDGPSVFLGHVDSTSGPGVFYRVGALLPGDHVLVTRRDGRTTTYVIIGVRRYPKDAFPTMDVYANTAVPTIRLITCGGVFDTTTHHYLSNIIAFGQQSGSLS